MLLVRYKHGGGGYRVWDPVAEVVVESNVSDAAWCRPHWPITRVTTNLLSSTTNARWTPFCAWVDHFHTASSREAPGTFWSPPPPAPPALPRVATHLPGRLVKGNPVEPHTHGGAYVPDSYSMTRK